MKSIIYIDRNNLYFYGGNVHAPLTLPFQPTVVRDIEVINAEELEKQVAAFIQSNKIEPSECGMIIAHQSSFAKVIPPKTPPEQIEQQRKQFLDNVPFEDILKKEFTTEKGIKIITTNKDLAYLIRDIFNKNHFTVEFIAPAAALYPDGDVTFNATAAQQILNKASVLKQQSFDLKDQEIPVTDTFEEGFVKKKKNASLYYMIPLFVILIGVLVWLIMGQGQSDTDKDAKTPTPSLVSARRNATPTIEPTITNTASPEAALLEKDSISFQVLNGSGISGQADTVREALIDEDYSEVVTGNAPTQQSSRSLIVYKSNIPTSQIQEIVDILSPIIGEVTTQVNEEIEYDVRITTSINQTNQNTTPSPSP